MFANKTPKARQLVTLGTELVCSDTQIRGVKNMTNILRELACVAPNARSTLADFRTSVFHTRLCTDSFLSEYAKPDITNKCGCYKHLLTVAD
jgi:hypothetical protein